MKNILCMDHYSIQSKNLSNSPNTGCKGISRVVDDLSEALGNVPILKLNRISAVCSQQDIYLKLEACNPGGSIKEKNAFFLADMAQQQGQLKPGGTIVESSSGNFGIGLAMVGAARGYRVIIVVDAKTSPTMRRLLTAYGAELVDVPLSEADANGSMQVARMKKAAELATEIPGAWYPCQHRNPLNPLAHWKYTAREIEQAFNGAPDAIVLGVSTAGQLGGVAKFFRQHYPEVVIIGVDVAGSAILGTPVHSYKMTGLGLSFIPPNFNSRHLDLAYSISDRLAFSLCRQLAKREGLLLGSSTGAITAAGLAFAASQSNRKKIVMINPDRGDRYIETIYNDEWIRSQKLELYENEGDLQKAISDTLPVPSILYNEGDHK